MIEHIFSQKSEKIDGTRCKHIALCDVVVNEIKALCGIDIGNL